MKHCFLLRPWKWEQSQNALQAYVAFFGLLSLGQIPALKTIRYVELPYFVGLACLTIYIGAHRGLTNKVNSIITLPCLFTCPSPLLHNLQYYIPQDLSGGCDAFFDADEAADQLSARSSGTTGSFCRTVWRLSADQILAVDQSADCEQCLLLSHRLSSSNWCLAAALQTCSECSAFPTSSL